MNEIEAIYQKALYPLFQKQFRIIHNTDNTTNIILDGEQEEFYGISEGSINRVLLFLKAILEEAGLYER